MPYNHLFWKSYFHHSFIPQLKAILEALEERLLPAFDRIEEEATRISEEVWQTFMSSPGTGDEDADSMAETAQEFGVSHYMLQSGIKQGMINLFAAALYHAFEQQVMVFHRREVLNISEDDKAELFEIHIFKSRLKNLGINIGKFSSWKKIDELRLVANAVKHAEGNSATELFSLRPDFFKSPVTLEDEASYGNSDTPFPMKPRVDLPLLGEDLYLSVSDLREYLSSLTQFWDELVAALAQAKPHSRKECIPEDLCNSE